MKCGMLKHLKFMRPGSRGRFALDTLADLGSDIRHFVAHNSGVLHSNEMRRWRRWHHLRPVEARAQLSAYAGPCVLRE